MTRDEYGDHGQKIATTKSKKVYYRDNRALGAEAKQLAEGLADPEAGRGSLLSNPVTWLAGGGLAKMVHSLGASSGRNQLRAAQSLTVKPTGAPA